MADLPTNLKDDILDSSVNTRRKYRMIENPDGTVEFEDATEYSQVGDEYGAGLINETNKQVNARVEKAVVVRDLGTIDAITQPGFIPDALALKDVNDSLKTVKTYVDEDGKLHFVDSEGADSVLPFSSFKRYYSETTVQTSNTSQTIEVGFKPKLLYLFGAGITWTYIEPLFGEYYFYNGDLAHKVPIGSWDNARNLLLSEITENGFSVQSSSKFNLYVLAYG